MEGLNDAKAVVEIIELWRDTIILELRSLLQAVGNK